MQVENYNGYYSCDIIVIHDGYNSILIKYGEINTTATAVGTFTTDLVGGQVRLLFQTNNDDSAFLTYNRVTLSLRDPDEGFPLDLMIGAGTYDLLTQSGFGRDLML